MYRLLGLEALERFTRSCAKAATRIAALRAYSLLAAVGIAIASVLAQRATHPTLRVAVAIDTLGRTGTTRVAGLRIAVAASSAQSLLSFYLDAPVPVVGDTAHLVFAGISGHWMVMTRFADRRVTSWTNARRPTPAGETTPRFLISGQGVFGLVRYWTAFPEDPAEPDSMPAERPDSIPTIDTIVRTNGPTGWTVGIVAPPPVESAIAATDRLRSSVSTLCDLDLISPIGVCTSLQANLASPTPRLDAIAQELEAQRGKHISEGAYWILVDRLDHLRQSIRP